MIKNNMRYHIKYSPETEKHLEALTMRQQKIVLDAVEKQLKHSLMLRREIENP